MKLYIVSYSVEDRLNDELYLAEPEVFTSEEEAKQYIEQTVNDELAEYEFDEENYSIDDQERGKTEPAVIDRTIVITPNNRAARAFGGETGRTFILKARTK